MQGDHYVAVSIPVSWSLNFDWTIRLDSADTQQKFVQKKKELRWIFPIVTIASTVNSVSRGDTVLQY